jgi:hypothetical protein
MYLHKVSPVDEFHSLFNDGICLISPEIFTSDYNYEEDSRLFNFSCCIIDGGLFGEEDGKHN